MDWSNGMAAHRVDRPVMLQRWESLTFLHWPYDAAVIQRLLPPGLQVDTFGGKAWVGLVPFRISSLRLPVGPAAPWLSAFPETNVRTYVTGPDGTPGVWFFTLEADRLIAVAAARLTYHLPYRWADMRVKDNGHLLRYESVRRWPFGSAFTDIEIQRGKGVPSAALDHFLTARFRLYTTAAYGRLAYANVSHPPWEFSRGTVRKLRENLVENSGVPAPRGEPLVHVAQTVDVRAERLRRA